MSVVSRLSVWRVLVTVGLVWVVVAVVGSRWCGPRDADRLGIFLDPENQTSYVGDVRDLEVAWNKLCYGSQPPKLLQIAVFVKKWPTGGVPGGLERHAMTLHRALADRGHVVHVFTVRQAGAATTMSEAEDVAAEVGLHPRLRLHFVQANANGNFDHGRGFERFAAVNATLGLRGFDVVHSESVALPHGRAKGLENVAASWHGIQFEMVHSDIVQELIRSPAEERSVEPMSGRLMRVADEVRFFPSYRHHIATSDFVGGVLRTIYELPLRNVHIILNGVDVNAFRPNPSAGAAFRAKYGVPENASLVLGAAGRLVRDKGHALLFEAFSEVAKRHKGVYLLVAGSGPWGRRYNELASHVKALGALAPTELAEFYNAVDIFVNPTMRAQGLDHTLLEAMQCGKPLMATHFSSIVMSIITDRRFGYTFSPNVPSLVAALEAVVHDGKEALQAKGRVSRSRRQDFHGREDGVRLRAPLSLHDQQHLLPISLALRPPRMLPFLTTTGPPSNSDATKRRKSSANLSS